ncbi:helix-turn-helix domain-containing protein [Oscillochloris sp. ZM17-4]|uniref:helix-turn-helix domain-containing protein n=1 Tax=Oscillochloris sp. ZM17-4 TaxID=2866714 RepID=UPI001C732CD2|nr:helix-turn-helix domain-containing protein [Oscillochloris sp. ZM17-4]MBX0326681.1 helix-turn-helix domain-containing protein [Oscillochloris sp. ZM17-4]
MTVRQVAIYLNVAPKVVYRLVNGGRLPGFKVAGTWRFMRQDIDTWIEQQKQRVTASVGLAGDVSRVGHSLATEAKDA